MISRDSCERARSSSRWPSSITSNNMLTSASVSCAGPGIACTPPARPIFVAVPPIASWMPPSAEPRVRAGGVGILQQAEHRQHVVL